MIELVEFKAEHAELLCPNAVDETLRHTPPEIWRQMAAYNEVSGMGFTGFYNGKPVGAAGVRHVREGVGNMWAVIAQDALCAKSIFRAVRDMLAIIADVRGYRRLRSESRIGFAESQRLLEHLGFVRRRVIMNGTHYYYVKVI